IVSETAKRGLDASPVPLNLTGKTSAQIEQIGQGSYLVNAVADCSGCHSGNPPQFLSGGAPFPLGPGAVVWSRNLTPDTATGMTLTEDQFIKVMRTGADFRPGAEGQALIVMPWYYFRWFGIDDLKAIYAYLKVIPAASNVVPPDMKGTLEALTPI